jgi:beta-1,4-N-acetylglucosaminyltransferase
MSGTNSSSKKKRTAASRAARRAAQSAVEDDGSIAAAAPTVSKVTAAAVAAAASPSPTSNVSPSFSAASGGPHSSVGTSGSRLLFLTVGTTRFDALLEAWNRDAQALVAWLVEQSFVEAQFQIGTGTVEPLALRDAAEEWNVAHANNKTPPLRISWFRHSPDLLSLVSRASLVVSHAGAGSILESLRRSRPLLVVINDTLMQNHQAEVADALAEGRFLYQTTPAKLLQTLRTADWSAPVELPAVTASVAAASAPATSASSSPSPSSSSDSSFPRYQLRRYPPVQSDAFPRLLEEHVAQVLRPSSATTGSSAKQRVLPFVLTVLLPALLAIAITWVVFA